VHVLRGLSYMLAFAPSAGAHAFAFFFFLFTTLKPPHSFCAGFGWARTTSAIDAPPPVRPAPGVTVALFGRAALSALRRARKSDAKRRPSSVVLFA
jgi:hypothetical protein